MIRVMKPQLSTLQITTISIGFIALIWFFWPQIATIVFTTLMAYIFYPLFLRLRRKSGRSAAFTTLLISFLVVLIPLTFIVIAAVGQLIEFADMAGRMGTWQNLPDIATSMIAATNRFMESITGNSWNIAETDILDFIRNTLPVIAQASVGVLFGIIASLPQAALAILIYVFVFVELLLSGPQLVDKVKALSPYDTKTTNLYLDRMGLMAKAMVTGQLMISLIISALSALLLIPLGYGNYFFILLIVFTILNFMPLGSGIIVAPLALYSMATGQFWMGLIILILYYLVGWLDPILRPLFIPKQIHLSPALMLLSVFCGVAYFGILGVVYGPIVLMLILTVFDLYIDAKKPLKHELLRRKS